MKKHPRNRDQGLGAGRASGRDQDEHQHGRGCRDARPRPRSIGSARELRAAEGDLKTARTEYRAALEAYVETGAPVVVDAETRERLDAPIGKATIGAISPGPNAGADAEQAS